MKPSPTFLFSDMDEQQSSAMDVDDNDPLEMMASEGLGHFEQKLTDSDFFNAFEDDFDDTDIN